MNGRTTFAAGQPSLLRAINERSVLELIKTGGTTSRAQIARQSGLSKPTVSLALTGLIDSGLVCEVGKSTGRKGPSAVLYELNPKAGFVVGIDVGRQYLRVALADIAGRIAARRDERAMSRSSGALVRQIGELAHRVAADAGLRWPEVTQAVVGNPGVLDPSRGQLAHVPNLPGWGRQGLVQAIRDQLGTSVRFENDVNLAALGERAHGLGRTAPTFVYLWIGTGVGMGLVLDGNLYRGVGGAAGEIGYLPVGVGDPHDPANRRRGVLEESLGAAAIVRLGRERGMSPPLTPKRIFAAARGGDPVAGQVVEEVARRIALAIAAVAPVVDPGLVILGGGIAHSGDLLLRPVSAELRRISPFRPEIAASELGDDAVLLGAVATALDDAQERLFSRSPDNDRLEIVV